MMEAGAVQSAGQSAGPMSQTCGIEPRETVRRLEAYHPPLEGRRAFTRLDFNENTTGFPDACGSDPPDRWTAYPEYAPLIEALSEVWALPPECLLPTNGSDEALFFSAFTFIEPGRDAALTVSPTFSLIPHYLQLVGSRLTEIPYTANFTHDIPAIEAALSKGVRLAAFASPDNPTGALLPLEIIRRWCAVWPDTLFVIDEAYAEFSGVSALSLLREFDNLLVTRTFSKAWGMAGLRLGMIAGNPRLIGYLRRAVSPYSVNASAVETALRMLRRQPEVLREAKETMHRKAWVLEEVSRRGYQTVAGHANFFLLRVGADTAGFCAFFRERGVLLRDQNARPGMQGMVRVTIGNSAEMNQFLAILDEMRQKRVVLFDMDGTLVDTSRSFDAVIAQLVLRYAKQPLAKGELETLRNEGGFNDDWDATVELLKRRGVAIDPAEIAREGQALYLELAAQTETWMGDPVLLEAIGKRYRLGVATGRYRAEFDAIWGERFNAVFEMVACQDDCPQWRKKPSPDLLQGALKAMAAETGFYIGNSVDDMRAARAAGLIPVGITDGKNAESLRQAGATYVLNALDELKGWLM